MEMISGGTSTGSELFDGLMGVVLVMLKFASSIGVVELLPLFRFISTRVEDNRFEIVVDVMSVLFLFGRDARSVKFG